MVAEIIAADALDTAFVSSANIDRALEARRLDSRIRVQVRPDTVKDVEAVLAAFDPPPDIVETEVTVMDEVLPLVEPAPSKVFADSWNDAGIHILQSELPHLLAEALGR